MPKTETPRPRSSEQERPRADGTLLYRELKTGCVLYHPVTNEAHVLNLTAAYIWNCCDGTRDVTAIAADMAKVCRVPIEEAQRDVRKALRSFRAKQLIHP